MISQNKDHYIVILSGGQGTRLWPLSTKAKPKQFLKINSHINLIEQTTTVFQKYFSKQNIFLVTTKNYQRIAHKYWKNLIVEPKKKNTALAIFYSTSKIYQKNKNAIITIIPSDHYYQNIDYNLSLIQKSQEYCQKNPQSIYLFGQKNTKPDKSFTYLVNKDQKIIKIVEKPSLKYSSILIKKGIISADTFTFSAKLLIDFIQEEKINLNYNTANPISFEKFLKTKKDKLALFSDKFEFIDLGEWKNVFDILPKDRNEIATNIKNIYQYKSVKSLIISENKKKIYGLVGCNNLAIIDTPQALLVCNMAHDLSYNVKNIVKQIHDKK